MKLKAGDRVYYARRSWRDPEPSTVVKATDKQVVIQEDPAPDDSYQGTKWTIRGNEIDHIFHTLPEAFEHLAQQEDAEAARAEERAAEHRNNAAEFRRKAREPKTN